METGLETLSDFAVDAALEEAVQNERASVATVLRCFVEFERRRRLKDKPYPSMFEYCTRHLGYAKDAALKRIRGARAISDFPEIMPLLEAGKTNLSRIVAVYPHLTAENKDALLANMIG